jgi:hypothetical protein
MAARNTHTWKTTTADGIKREVRAEKFAKKWRLQAQLKGETTWTYYDTPPLEDLIELRDVLWRKYQRRHLSFEDIESIDALIRERQGEL